MKDRELEEVGLEVVANIKKGFTLLDGLSGVLSKPGGLLTEALKKICTLVAEIVKLRAENAQLKAEALEYKLEIGRLQRINIKDKIELNRLKGGTAPADITSVMIKKKK
jgi:hypothetical protein